MNSKQRRRQNRSQKVKAGKRNYTPAAVGQCPFTLQIRAEGDTIRAAISSETPVKRPFGWEVLDHGSVNMARAATGLPLIVQHDHDGPLPIGRVRNLSVDADRVMRGDLAFSSRAEAQSMRQDVLDGIITDVSVGYAPDPDKISKTGDTYRLRNWTPYEVSLVSIGADPNAGINRGLETMDREKEIRAAFERYMARAGVRELLTRCIEDESITVDQARAQLLELIAADDKKGDDDEPSNAELAIRRSFAPFITRAGVAELQERMVKEAKRPGEALQALLDHIGQAGNAKPGSATDVVAGETDTEKFGRAVENAIMIRSSHATKEEREAARENPYTSYSMVELARAYLGMNRISIAGLTASGLIGRAIDPGTANLDTTDFPAILENVMNKTMFRGFQEAEVTWQMWCSTGSERDFKPYTRPGVSQFDSFEVVDENAEIQDGTLVDKKEGAQIQTFAKKLSLTREAMVNDDLGAFTDAAFKIGQAGNRTVDETVYTLLESNPDMTEDSVALFAAAAVPTGHGNLITAGAPPTEALVTAGKVAMAGQVDQNGIILGIRPRFMLTGIPLEETAIKLATAEYSPDGSANPFEPNSVRNTFVPISSARLSAAPWYLMGPQGTTCEVTFLNGQQQPSLERESGWSTFAMHWRAWIDFAALFLDWRATFQNDGVT